MANNCVQEEGGITVANLEQLASDMEEEIKRCTRGLQSYSAKSTCCIYKVPLKLEKNNDKHWYSPRIVSIGPYHYEEGDLNRDYKYQFFGSFLSRTRAGKGIGIEDYLKKLLPLETKVRECYSENVKLESGTEFLEMIVLDASFILGLFYKFQDSGPHETDEPLALLKWRLPYFCVDLLLLENQIPFFVLQELFDISKMPDDPSLSVLALQFFNNVMQRPKEVIERYDDNPENPPVHLLDLVRSSLIPNDPMRPQKEEFMIPFFSRLRQKDNTTLTQFIPCIWKLRRSGISVRPRKADSFLAVNFEYGVVEIPSIIIDDFMRYLLLNCVAFEQCHNSCSKHVTVYATFLCSLVDNPADVKYLRECGVIENYDVDRVADFIHSMGRDLAIDIDDFYLSRVFNDVDKHYRNDFYVKFTSFMRRSFYTQWPFLSFLAAAVLLLLTIAQAYIAIIGYVHPKK
ncbi:UPF0481 protein At3g47200-like [Corylus avellana]|uniref:UPF0481 protein At3g47200-like n=1 Tax=Corylus avellana TaxID=13451 RepID=UPI001E22A92B|nr:UPF0481 protein At3g47200-like [Corylus avellana]